VLDVLSRWNSLGKTNKYLLLVAVLLFFVAVGLYAYMVGSEERYIAKCRTGAQVVADIKDMLGEIKELKGDPEGEDVQAYLERLEHAQENIKTLSHEMQGIHVGSKYQQTNQALLAALQMEGEILHEVEGVLKSPLAANSKETVQKVKEQAKSIAETDVSIPPMDFSAAFKIGDVGEALEGYIARKKALDAARREEEERRAREAEQARLEAIRQRLGQKNSNIMATTSDVEWLTTQIRFIDSSHLALDGFFYNGTSNPIVKIDSMELTVTLYRRESQIYSDTFYFYNLICNGLIFPRKRQDRVLNITSVNGGIPSDFDEFDVTMSNANWTYRI